MKALCFGEVLWDVYPNKSYIGGAPLNFAAHLARHGDNAYMLSSFGEDELGAEALVILNRFGVFSKYCSVLDDKQTGKCLVELDENSVPRYNLLEEVAYDYINCDGIDEEFDLLYFGTLALRSKYNLTSLKTLISYKKFKDIFVDVNIRPPYFSKENVLFALAKATIVKISDEELSTVAKLVGVEQGDSSTFAKSLFKIFSQLKYIVITLGEKGAYVYDTANDNEISCPAAKVKPVSTVGAGDSFCAAFVHKIYEGVSIKESLEYASRLAGVVVSNFDAIPDYNPDRI